MPYNFKQSSSLSYNFKSNFIKINLTLSENNPNEKTKRKIAIEKRIS